MGRVGPQATVSELSLICDINRDSLMELVSQHMDSQIVRAVAKTSSCWVYANSRRGIVQIGSSLGSIILLFPIKVAGAHAHSNRGKSPVPGS